MKGFTKFLIALAAVFVGVIGALAVFDKFSNKNRIKGDYLECDVGDLLKFDGKLEDDDE